MPQHVTIRLRVGRLRMKTVHAALKGILRALKKWIDFRVLAYSVQDDHIHLLVEGDSVEAFNFGIRALGIRIGLRLNRALARVGPLFADRHHRRGLATPREVRNAWTYVLLNRRKHLAKSGAALGAVGVDPFSSGGWFDGWTRPMWRDPEEPAVTAARTWLGAIGWKRRGLVSPTEVPGQG